MSNESPHRSVRPEAGTAARKRVLVFRQAPHDIQSLVFTSLKRAKENDRLHRAIESSKTWGDFRRAIGSEEYAKLYEDVFYKPEPDEDPEDIPQDELEPADDAPFRAESVPGYCDGDYPPWLAQEMDLYLPEEILDRFATRHSSVINGPFYSIELTQREGILKALADAGFAVEEREDLVFW